MTVGECFGKSRDSLALCGQEEDEDMDMEEDLGEDVGESRVKELWALWENFGQGLGECLRDCVNESGTNPVD